MDFEPVSMAANMAQEFYVVIPERLDTPEDLRQANQLLSDLTNKYSYMSGIFIVLKAQVRTLGKKDAAYSEMISKRDTVDGICSMIQQQYNALSRMITVKQEQNRELAMMKTQ
jgi:hypothetical protein